MSCMVFRKGTHKLTRGDEAHAAPPLAGRACAGVALLNFVAGRHKILIQFAREAAACGLRLRCRVAAARALCSNMGALRAVTVAKFATRSSATCAEECQPGALGSVIAAKQIQYIYSQLRPL